MGSSISTTSIKSVSNNAEATQVASPSSSTRGSLRSKINCTHLRNYHIKIEVGNVESNNLKRNDL